MPRRQRNTGRSRAPSQRQRVGEFSLRVIVALTATFAAPSPAAAEVCDKVVGEFWHPSHGPAWTTGPTLLWSLVPPLFGIFLLAIPSILILGIFGSDRFRNAAGKVKWLGYFGAAFF